MGRIYSVSFTGDGHSAAEDLFGIYAGSVIALRIRELGLGAYNYGSIEDADLQIWRRGGTITPGSGGGIVTPTALRSTDPAASFIAHNNDTTQSGSTIQERWLATGWNMAEKLLYVPDEDLALIIQPNEAAIIICSTGTGFGVAFDGYCLVEELS